MLISERQAAAMSAQIGREFGAMLQYVAVAAYFDRESLPQLAERFYAQAEEEKMHAMKLAHYVTDAGGNLAIPAVAAPKSDVQSAEEAVQLSLDWELEVTRQINDLVRIAVEESDFLTQNFLQWFVNEQLEEVSTMETLLRTVQRAGDNLLLVEEFIAREPNPSGA
ncbi:MAG: ferritin [Anaerolineales bacterium]